MPQANENQHESARSLLGQALTFVGPLVMVGGGLAIWRLKHTAEARDLLYVSLMPIGLGVWALGFYLRLGERPAARTDPEIPGKVTAVSERSLIDSKGLGRIARLELVARQAVEGYVTGKHPSPFHGSSVEYADHRPYTLSDEIRAIDWKLLAKTDKYYIKLYQEQTNLRCTILLDVSKSMSLGETGQPGGVSKLVYGSRVAAALGYLMLGQSDAVGLALFDDKVREYLPPRSTPTHFKRMVRLMEEARPGSDTRLGPVLHEMANRVKRRGMVIVVTDLLCDLKEIADGLAHFRYARHEVLVFHVMDRAELEFPFERLARFKDMEGVGVVTANPRSVRARYLERLGVFLKEVKAACLERGVSYQLCPTDQPYDQMLSAFLDRRARMK